MKNYKGGYQIIDLKNTITYDNGQYVINEEDIEIIEDCLNKYNDKEPKLFLVIFSYIDEDGTKHDVHSLTSFTKIDNNIALSGTCFNEGMGVTCLFSFYKVDTISFIFKIIE